MNIQTAWQVSKSIDETIHRQYEKLSSKLERIHPDARYYVAMGLALAPAMHYSKIPIKHIGFFAGTATVAGMYMLSEGQYKTEQTSNTKVRDDSLGDLYVGIGKLTRTPLLGLGIGFLTKGIYDIVNGILNQEPIPQDTYENLIHGTSIISLASASYLMDKKTSLLDRKPLRKQIREWINNKINNLIPQPAPKPIPVRQSISLEKCI